MTAETPSSAVSADEVLLNLPTPVVAHDADGSVVYANEAFRTVSVSDPTGMEIGAVLDGYEPGEGGGFVTPDGTDRRFVAVVRTPSRVERGEPSATTVLVLRATPDEMERSATALRAPETGQVDSRVESTRSSASTEPPGTDVSADEVLTSLATPIVAHDANGSVTYANEAFQRASVPDSVGDEVGAVIDGYEPGGDGGIVTPRGSSRDFFALVRTARSSDAGDSGRPTVLLLRTRAPNDVADVAPTARRSGLGWLTDTGIAESLERIFENSNECVFVLSLEQHEFGTVFVYVNECACEMLGYERSELMALSPRDVHPHDYPEVDEFFAEVLDEGSSWTAELSCYHSNGDIVPVEVSASVVELGGRQLLVAHTNDISTRVEQRAELRRLSRAMQATTEGVALFDRDGMATYANPAFAETVGATTAEDVRGRTWDELFDGNDRFEMAVRPAAESEGGWSDTIQVATDAGERAYALSVTAFDRYLLCVSRDVTERQRRVERLRGLTAASRAFVDSENTESVAETAVTVIKDTLGFQAACLRIYDSETNTLDRVAETTHAAALLSEEVAYDMDASRAGRAFRTGERLLIESGDDPYAADRGHLHVPVGDTGVITVASPDGFREGDAELIALLAETVRTALTRVERLEQLREREAQLDRRRSELAAVVEFDELVTDVIESVVSSSTRRETEKEVCDRLVDSDRYVGAWILDENRTARASATTDAAGAPAVEDFVESTFATRLLDKASDGLAVERRRFDAGEESETTTAAAIPITYGQQWFGEIVLVTREDNAFPEAARAGVKLLAETLGFAVVATRSQEALVSKNVTEVEIELSTLFADLSGEHDCRCTLVEVNSTPTGELEYVGKVEGADAATVRSAFADSPGVKSVTADGPDECTVRLVGSGNVPEVFARLGANIRSVEAEGGSEYVTAEVPEGVDVSELLSRLGEQLDDESVLGLHAKRSRRRLAPDHVISEDALTVRQRDVTCTAYDAGYYEWPREHTAEEVAEMLDIAPSTLHEHLRTAQGKLAEQLCEADTVSE